MSRLTLTGLALPLFLLFASPPASAPKAFGATKETPEVQGQTGTFQKMIVENGSVTMDLDLNRLNGISSLPARPVDAGFRRRSQFLFHHSWFSTICCAGPSRAQWRSSRIAAPTLPGYTLPGISRDLSSNSLSRNFLQTQPLISLCATAKLGSPSSTSKDISTITMPTHSR